MLRNLLFVLVSLMLVQPMDGADRRDPAVQVIAYVFPSGAALQPGQVDARGVTRINYAFAGVKDGSVAAGSPNDAANLALLTGLRKDNVALEVLISAGGWLGSGQFSDAALSEESRKKFIESAMDFIDRYHLDGIDIDWEYPGLRGAGNTFRNEDGKNFTFLLKELRARLDGVSRETGKKLLLTIAAGADEDYLAHTEMGEAQKYVDTVNVMAYDYYEPGSGVITGNHAPLFTDPADPAKVSADASVTAFEKAGVPAQKIVLGVPFYGHMWGEVNGDNHGLYQAGKAIPNNYAPFGLIDSTMLNQGFTRYWDAASSAAYLYSADKRVFVSYEDEESLAAKCRYVLQHKLGGIMFWHYSNDSHGKLLRTIDSGLLGDKAQPAGPR